VRAALRRKLVAGAAGNPSVRFGDVEVDSSARTVRKAGQTVHLTPIQYWLPALLVSSAGRVPTRYPICREVWGPSHEQSTHCARIYMAHPRQKLENDLAQRKHILTEIGVGYRLMV
jgi:two-component system, OmpR family, KDP operon response regulator KdpE